MRPLRAHAAILGLGALALLASSQALPAGATAATGASCTLEGVRSLASPPLSIDRVSHVDGTAAIASYCAVFGHIRHGTAIGFELGLPDGWNQKYLFYGIGGFAGQLDPIVAGLAKGYASGTSDTGHVGTSVQDAAWALHNPAGVLNHFESGTALPASALKALTAAYYRHVPVHAYFQGCSAGGRQAIVEAERFPSTFDGIIAGAPAWDYSKLLVSFIENGKAILRSSANWIPPEDFDAIDRVVQAQCSVKAGDGTADGLLVNPLRCRPNLQVLLCRKGAGHGPCLTQAQIATVREIATAAFARAAPGYFGYPLAGSAGDAGLSWGWSKWFFGTLPPAADRQGRLDFRSDVLPQGSDLGQGPNQFLLGEQFLRYMVMDDPSYDARTFAFSKDAVRLDRKLGGLLDATQTDLGPFVRLGGKLLIWHGWSDPAIPPQMSIELYQRIEQSTRRYEDQPGSSDSVRLFLVPGVQHCGGGAGLTDFDPLDALDTWVAEGHAPDRISASQIADGKPVRSRPLCPYPKAAHYLGSGDPRQASSFVCR
jgi:feruloyl esterase